MTLDPREITRIIRHRRSIPPERFVPNAKVDESIIREMLENANWAPTHGLTEPWRFTVFSESGLKKLGEFQAELYGRITPSDEFKQSKYDKLSQRPMLASFVISIGMRRQVTGKIPEVEEIEAVACAVQNMCLTASAYQVATYWTSGGITYEKEAKEFFGLTTNDHLLGFLYVGKVDDEWPQGKRGEWSDKVKWII